MLFAAEVATTHKALANLDLAIIGVYFLIVFGIGFYFSRRERTSEQYFLAGRDIGWFFYRCVAVCFEYFHGTFYRTFGDGRVIRAGGRAF